MTQKPKTIIRAGEALDLDSIVDIHFKCFSWRKHLATALGKTFIRSVYKWFVDSDISITLVALQDGQIVGFHTACNGRYHRLMFANNKVAAIKAFLTKPWLILNKDFMQRVWRWKFTSERIEIRLDVGEELCHFAFVGILPGHRRSGVARELASRTLDECKKKGWTKVKVLVYDVNKSVINMMRDMGFREEKMYQSGRILYELDLN